MLERIARRLIPGLATRYEASGDKYKVPWKEIEPYIPPGGRVAEICWGGRSDILLGLSQRMGNSGIVYGVDRLDFTKDPRVWLVNKKTNITLVTSPLQDLPAEVSNLDAIVIREFGWTHYTSESQPDRYTIAQNILDALKPNGYFITHEHAGYAPPFAPIAWQDAEVNALYGGKLIRVYPEDPSVNGSVVVYRKRPTEAE